MKRVRAIGGLKRKPPDGGENRAKMAKKPLP
jgi:hypothetical protein